MNVRIEMTMFNAGHSLTRTRKSGEARATVLSNSLLSIRRGWGQLVKLQASSIARSEKNQRKAFGLNQRPLAQFHGGLRGWRMWYGGLIDPKGIRILLISASIGHEAHLDQTAISSVGNR
jgi:hypothetical protein